MGIIFLNQNNIVLDLSSKKSPYPKGIYTVLGYRKNADFSTDVNGV